MTLREFIGHQSTLPIGQGHTIREHLANPTVFTTSIIYIDKVKDFGVKLHQNNIQIKLIDNIISTEIKNNTIEIEIKSKKIDLSIKESNYVIDI